VHVVDDKEEVQYERVMHGVNEVDLKQGVVDIDIMRV